jgi:hypothetical protein
MDLFSAQELNRKFEREEAISCPAGRCKKSERLLTLQFGVESFIKSKAEDHGRKPVEDAFSCRCLTLDGKDLFSFLPLDGGGQVGVTEGLLTHPRPLPSREGKKERSKFMHANLDNVFMTKTPEKQGAEDKAIKQDIDQRIEGPESTE